MEIKKVLLDKGGKKEEKGRVCSPPNAFGVGTDRGVPPPPAKPKGTDGEWLIAAPFF